MAGASAVPRDAAAGRDAVLWVVPALCALFGKSAPPERDLRKAHRTTHDAFGALCAVLSDAGFTVGRHHVDAARIASRPFPLLVALRHEADAEPHIGLALGATGDSVVLAERDHPPRRVALEEFARRFRGDIAAVAEAAPAVSDPDAVAAGARDRVFGFRWFVPEPLKHRHI